MNKFAHGFRTWLLCPTHRTVRLVIGQANEIYTLACGCRRRANILSPLETKILNSNVGRLVERLDFSDTGDDSIDEEIAETA